MSKLITILTIALLAGCVSNARIDTLERRLAASEDQNRRLKTAMSDGYQPPGAPALPSANPAAPGLTAPGMAPMNGGQVSTGVMVARQQHGVYMGAVGEQPRQVTQGRKVQVSNLVCDDNARDSGLNCADKDENGEPDFNTWLSFSIDGHAVICDSGFFHPDMHVSMLLPQQSCFVELGGNRTVKLRIQAFRNNGNPWSYLDLDTTPYSTTYVTVTVKNGMRTLKLDETDF